MAHSQRTRLAFLLPMLLVALCLSGCMTRRTRLMEERSELLRQRDQLQDPWQAHPVQTAGKDQDRKHTTTDDEEEPTPPAERVKKLDQRVAEIDAKLLQLK